MARTLTRYQPQNDVTRLPEVMDRLFRDSFVAQFLPSSFSGGTASPMLPVNLYETTDSYILFAALPGLNPDNVDIQVSGREVTIRGKVEITTPEEGAWIWQGIQTGDFYETFTVPVDLDSDKVQASYDLGILTIGLPKAEHVRPKNVKVSVKQ